MGPWDRPEPETEPTDDGPWSPASADAPTAKDVMGALLAFLLIVIVIAGLSWAVDALRRTIGL